MTQQRLDFAVSLLPALGAIALQYFRADPRSLALENKLSGTGIGVGIEGKLTDLAFDPVTVADQSIELHLREALHKTFPQDGIVGEEQGTILGQSEYTWVIDPIDGTRAFITGMPTWGILIGLQRNGVACAGILHQPYMHESWISDGEHTRFVRNELASPCKTSAVEQLGEASLYCTHPAIFADLPGGLTAFEAVAAQCRLPRYGGDCYSYGLLASGQIDLVIEAGLQAYDIQALIPIVEAAGGVVSDWDGLRVSAGGKVIAAATKRLHAQALNALNI